MSSSLTTYMFINKELPPSIESEVEQIARDHRMRKRNGEYPLVRFARRLLNMLWEKEGSARLSNEVLVKMVGTSNPNQQVSYRRLLQQAGLIEEGNGETDYLWQTWELLEGSPSDIPDDNVAQKQRSSYQPRAFSKTYRLSSRVKEAFEGYYPSAPTTGCRSLCAPREMTDKRSKTSLSTVSFRQGCLILSGDLLGGDPRLGGSRWRKRTSRAIARFGAGAKPVSGVAARAEGG